MDDFLRPSIYRLPCHNVIAVSLSVVRELLRSPDCRGIGLRLFARWLRRRFAEQGPLERIVAVESGEDLEEKRGFPD